MSNALKYLRDFNQPIMDYDDLIKKLEEGNISEEARLKIQEFLTTGQIMNDDLKLIIP